MKELFSEYLNPVFELLNYNLFALGNAKITPLSILYVLLFSIALIYVSKKLRDLLIRKLLTKTKLDVGAQTAIGTMVRYVFLLVGFLIIIQTVGIDLTTLNVLAGAVGVGIGFGLQNIANNFISGLIILMERPIKVGDRIEVDGVSGSVMAIGARSTRVKTNDNISIIVPNSKFISENVVTWSFNTDRVRFRIPVGVSYDSDIDLVSKLLIQVGEENKDVLAEPPPTVRLTEFGDNSLNFQLWVWSSAKLHRPGVLKSDINFAISRKFKQNNIEIPFPQRDLNFRSGNIRFEKDSSVENSEEKVS